MCEEEQASEEIVLPVKKKIKLWITRNIWFLSLLILGSCLICALWLITPCIVYKWSGLEITHAGEFGDMFGSINALFTGLAFIGVVATLIVQQIELREQEKSQAKQNTLFSKQLKIFHNTYKYSIKRELALASPRLFIVTPNRQMRRLVLALRNGGADISDIILTGTEEVTEITCRPHQRWDNTTPIDIVITHECTDEEISGISFFINYTNRLGDRIKQKATYIDNIIKMGIPRVVFDEWEVDLTEQ